MATHTVGLQTHIWNNNLRSIVFLALYPIIIMGIVWAVAGAVGMFLPHMPPPSVNSFGIIVNFANEVIIDYWPVIVSVIAIWFLISYFFHTRMIGKLAHSHPVTRKEEPELYNLLENLCIAQGLTMPKLNIIETHARNAFASGINDKSYSVTVTRGLMNSLQKDELEAVLAHELTHIINRDVRLLMVTVIFTGMIGFAAQLFWNSIRYNTFRYSGSGKNKGSSVMLILAIAAILWIGYMATLFMRFALSRQREFMADAGSVQMTKNPEAMMRALMRISGRDHIPETTDDIAMMCVENGHRFMGMFATHPPIDTRIEALSETTGTSVPEIKSLGPAPKEERFEQVRETKNPWLTRQRGPRRKL